MVDLSEYVHFHGDRLFSGAIDLDWYLLDKTKSEKVAASYFFNGPPSSTYISRKTVDSISLINQVIAQLNNDVEKPNPFQLVISGYGSGKSHFAVTLAELLSPTSSSIRETLLSHIREVNPKLSETIQKSLSNMKPCFILPINGMRDCNLFQELFRQAYAFVERDGGSLEPFYRFTPKYHSLYSFFLIHQDKKLINQILQSAGISSLSVFKDAMDSFNEEVYQKVITHVNECKDFGFYEPAAQGTIKELLQTIVENYCRAGQKYGTLLIIFDEFGKYMSFSSQNSGVAGSGALQLLFEGVTSKSEIHFLGMSQYDLKQYVSTVSKVNENAVNEINRYVTRYDNAQRLFLSVNLESLIASLMEKRSCFDSVKTVLHVPREIDRKQIISYFPSLGDRDVWQIQNQFEEQIVYGCWPLSYSSTMVLSLISSVRNTLQQRSIFQIINDTLERFPTIEDPNHFQIYPCDLFENGIEDEFYNSEQSGIDSRGVTICYREIIDLYGSKLSSELKLVLQGIVFMNKLHPVCTKEQCSLLISLFTGLNQIAVKSYLSKLEDEYSIVNFNSVAGIYEILSDGVTVSDFNHTLDQYIYKLSDTPENLAATFYYKNLADNSLLLSDIESDFNEAHQITTNEWRLKAYYANYGNIEDRIASIAKRLKTHIVVPTNSESDELNNTCRGAIIYTYINSSISLIDVQKKCSQYIHKYCYDEKKKQPLPVIILFIYDKENELIELLRKEKAVQNFNLSEKQKFKKFLKQQEQIQEGIKRVSEKLIRNRNIAIDSSVMNNQNRLKFYATQMFNDLYPSVISFPCDGFAGATGFSSIKKMIPFLSTNSPTFQSLSNMTTTDFNRATAILKNCWKVFDAKGSLSIVPGNEQVLQLFTIFTSFIKGSNSPIPLRILFNISCQPPFGANTSCATLLIVLYCAMNRKDVGLLLNGNLSFMGTMLNSLNAKNKLYDAKKLMFQEEVLNNCGLFYKKDGTQQWGDLMLHFREDHYYSSFLSLYAKAESLIKDCITIPEKDAFVFTNLTPTKDECQFHLQEFEKRNQTVELLRTTLPNTLSNYIAVLKDETDFFERMSKEPELSYWKESEKKKIESDLLWVKTKIQKILPKWIEENTLDPFYTTENYKPVLKMYLSLVKDLADFGMNKEAKFLSDTMEEVKQKRKKVSDLSLNRDNLRKQVIPILQSHLHNLSSVSMIIAKDDINICKDSLEKNKKISIAYSEIGKVDLGIEKEHDYITQALDTFNSYVIEKEKEYSSIIQNDIKTTNDLNEKKQKLLGLKLFYDGTEKETAILQMLDVVDYLMNCEDSLSNVSTWSQLKTVIERINKSLLMKNFNTPWPLASLVELFYQQNFERLQAQSVRWIHECEDEFKKINSMRDAVRLEEVLESPPAFIAETHLQKNAELLEKVKSIVSEKKVDALVLQFNLLSAEEKEKFKKMIN